MASIPNSPEALSAPQVVAARKHSRAAGPLIMVSGLLVAILAVLFVPAMVGGAATASSSSQALGDVSVQSYTAAGDATEALGFAPSFPSLPQGATVAAYRVMDGSVLEAEYRIDGATVLYRTAEGADDLSGELSSYSYTTTETVGGTSRTYAGQSDKKLMVAVWADSGNSYALIASDGVEADLLKELAQSI